MAKQPAFLVALVGSLLQYSPDDSASGEMLAQALLTNTVTISRSALIAGDMSRFRVWASDGLHTASDTINAPFCIPNHPPLVTILAPDAATTVVLSETVGLVAAVEDVAPAHCPIARSSGIPIWTGCVAMARN
jgi:hypothetical protein